jgi:hypothetical protein
MKGGKVVRGARKEREMNEKRETNLGEVSNDDVSMGVEDGEGDEEDKVRRKMVGEDVLQEGRNGPMISFDRMTMARNGEEQMDRVLTSHSTMISANLNSRLKSMRIHLRHWQHEKRNTVSRMFFSL